MSPSPGKQSPTHNVPNQGLATLLVMIAVLTIIILFCCFAAPGIRDICRKFCRCQIDNPHGGDAAARMRMLVVDRNIFAQLQADNTGIDFMELSANLIRSQRFHEGSTPSILDSEATSKGLSPTSLGISPPTYEDIFGDKNSDLPPSYSQLSLMFRGRDGVQGFCSEISTSGVCEVEAKNLRNAEVRGGNEGGVAQNGEGSRTRESNL